MKRNKVQSTINESDIIEILYDLMWSIILTIFAVIFQKLPCINDCIL